MLVVSHIGIVDSVVTLDEYYSEVKICRDLLLFKNIFIFFFGYSYGDEIYVHELGTLFVMFHVVLFFNLKSK